MGIFNIDLNNINLDGTNSEEDHPDTITLIRLLAWLIKFEIRKALKKDKWRINANSVESLKMVGLLHVRRCEKEIDPLFIEKL